MVQPRAGLRVLGRVQDELLTPCDCPKLARFLPQAPALRSAVIAERRTTDRMEPRRQAPP